MAFGMSPEKEFVSVTIPQEIKIFFKKGKWKILSIKVSYISCFPVLQCRSVCSHVVAKVFRAEICGKTQTIYFWLSLTSYLLYFAITSSDQYHPCMVLTHLHTLELLKNDRRTDDLSGLRKALDD